VFANSGGFDHGKSPFGAARIAATDNPRGGPGFPSLDRKTRRPRFGA
jgi:hypothetical protein